VREPVALREYMASLGERLHRVHNERSEERDQDQGR